MKQPTISDAKPWVTSQGISVVMCAFHELDPQTVVGVQSSFVAGGYSLCPEHFDQYMSLTLQGYSPLAIIQMLYSGALSAVPVSNGKYVCDMAEHEHGPKAIFDTVEDLTIHYINTHQ